MDCNKTNNIDYVCNPTNNTIWYISNNYSIQWNVNYPFIAFTDYIDIRLYSKIYNNVTVFANFTNIMTNTTNYHIYINPQWPIGVAYFRLRPSGIDTDPSIVNPMSIYPLDLEINIAKNNIPTLSSSSISFTPTQSSIVQQPSQNLTTPIVASVIPITLIAALLLYFYYRKIIRKKEKTNDKKMIVMEEIHNDNNKISLNNDKIQSDENNKKIFSNNDYKMSLNEDDKIIYIKPDDNDIIYTKPDDVVIYKPNQY